VKKKGTNLVIRICTFFLVNEFCKMANLRQEIAIIKLTSEL